MESTLSPARPARATSPTNRKRFQSLLPPYSPLILLDADGYIVHLTDTSRRFLEYQPEQAIDPLFVSHVHGKNLRQITRDLGSMSRLGKRQAFWLARLRTGRGRWNWYKITAENRLKGMEGVIVVRLRDLRD